MADIYITPTGGGLHDGSSVANAYTFDEFIAAGASAGDDVWIQVGNHTTSLTGVIVFPSGTQRDPVNYSAFVTAKEDYELTWNPYNYKITSQLASISATNAGYFETSATVSDLLQMFGVELITNTTTQRTMQVRCRYHFVGCVFRNEGNGTNSNHKAFQSSSSGTNGTAYLCNAYIEMFNSNDSQVAVQDSRLGNWVNCYIENTGSTRRGRGFSGVGISHSVIKNFEQAVESDIIQVADHITAVNCGSLMGNGNSDTIQQSRMTNSIIWDGDIISSKYGGDPLGSNVYNNRVEAIATDSTQPVGVRGGIISYLERNVALTGDPYMDAASDDYRLNDIAGAGAACKGAGLGGTDLGAIQSESSGGGSAIFPASSRSFGV